jgi:predicted ATPase
MNVSQTIKKPNNKLNNNTNFFNENSIKVKSIHEQRELQLDSSKNNNKNNLSKYAFDYGKTQSYAKNLLYFYGKFGTGLTSLVYHKYFTQNTMLTFLEYKSQMETQEIYLKKKKKKKKKKKTKILDTWECY